MGAYLIDNPPARRQFKERGGIPSGVIVLHTAENAPDWVGPDSGAEGVARFIRDRQDPGSYHIVADSDTRIRMVPFHLQAYGDGTGSNPHAVHISGATQAARWAQAPKAWRDGVVEQMAKGAAVYARWLKATHGITVPARRITRAESDRRVPGFISHGERDPERRTDPGRDFPWDQFLDAFRSAMGEKPPAKPEPAEPWWTVPVEPALLRVATGRLANVAAIAQASRISGVPFWAACALADMGHFRGRNVFDPADRQAVRGLPVTEDRFQAYYSQVTRGVVRPVRLGPAGLWWAGPKRADGRRAGGHFLEMEQVGLKPWKPVDNLQHALAILREAYNASGDSWEKAGARYGGNDQYGAAYLEKVKAWRVLMDAPSGGLNPALTFRPRYTRKK